MLLLHVLAFTCGVLIVLSTLTAAMRTFVLPRGVPVRLTRLVFLSIRVLFNMATRKVDTYEQRDSIMALYAPVALLAFPAVCLLLVLAGYMLLFWSLGFPTFRAAFTVSGSSLLTLGFAAVPTLATTVLAFTEAGIGLILAALIISYLPTMYSTFQRREAAVTMLEVRAGSPPSAIVMFIRFHRIGRMDHLRDMWIQWEIWFADLEENHTSLQAIVFFRSPQPDHSWVTAAGAVLDAAALAVSTIDIPHDAQADLCIRAGYLALRRIADFFSIAYTPEPTFPQTPISLSREEFDAACAEMAAAGVPLKADLDKAWQDFAGWRVNYDTVLIMLAQLTMAPYAPWSSDRGLRAQRPPLLPRFKLPRFKRAPRGGL